LTLDARLVSLSKYLSKPLRLIIMHTIVHGIKLIFGIGVGEVVAVGAVGRAVGLSGNGSGGRVKLEVAVLFFQRLLHYFQ